MLEYFLHKYNASNKIIEVLKKFNKHLIGLKNDKDFYQECSNESIQNYKENQSEKVFLNHMTKIFGELDENN